MKLLDARVNGMPRQVSTKYGEKSVLDVATSEGAYTIWRPACRIHRQCFRSLGLGTIDESGIFSLNRCCIANLERSKGDSTDDSRVSDIWGAGSIYHAQNRLLTGIKSRAMYR